MVNADRQITAIIVSTKVWSWHFALFICSTLGNWRLMLWALLQRRGCHTAIASLSFEFIWIKEESTKWHTRMWHLMVGFYLLHLGRLLRHELRWEVSEGAMWIFGGIVVLPRLIDLIGIFWQHILEMILGCITCNLHMIWVARLSRFRLLANVDCCTLGSIYW
jgi:hypothetical protein